METLFEDVIQIPIWAGKKIGGPHRHAPDNDPGMN